MTQSVSLRKHITSNAWQQLCPKSELQSNGQIFLEYYEETGKMTVNTGDGSAVKGTWHGSLRTRGPIQRTHVKERIYSTMLSLPSSPISWHTCAPVLTSFF